VGRGRDPVASPLATPLSGVDKVTFMIAPLCSSNVSKKDNIKDAFFPSLSLDKTVMLQMLVYTVGCCYTSIWQLMFLQTLVSTTSSRFSSLDSLMPQTLYGVGSIRRKEEWLISHCCSVNSVVNRYFRSQSSTWILDKKLDDVIEQFAQPYQRHLYSYSSRRESQKMENGGRSKYV